MIKELIEEHEENELRGELTVTFKQDKEAIYIKINADVNGKMIDALITELIIKRADLKGHRIEESLAQVTVTTVLEAHLRKGKK